MKIVFVSNMLNHHSYFLSNALRAISDEFCFVATKSAYVQGYQKPMEAEFVLHYDHEDQKKQAVEEVTTADVVVFGECPNELIEERMKDNKLSFLYSERFFKKGTWRRFIPQTRKKITERVLQYKNKDYYVLCASSYLPYDLSLMGFPSSKCFKWGYFPEVRHYDICHLIETKKPASILWASRLLDWKHPEAAVSVAGMLKAEGYAFIMRIVGAGPMEEQLKRQVQENGLEDCVILCGSMKPGEVRSIMEQSEVFLFTSDKNEGWGAVLNEAMNSGCAVVASDAIGSAPFLIEHKKNGLIYKNGDVRDCFEKAKALLNDSGTRREYGQNAYLSVTRFWNPEAAAHSLVRLSRAILDGQDGRTLIPDGPCSKAEIIKDNGFMP